MFRSHQDPQLVRPHSGWHFQERKPLAQYLSPLPPPLFSLPPPPFLSPLLPFLSRLRGTFIAFRTYIMISQLPSASSPSLQPTHNPPARKPTVRPPHPSNYPPTRPIFRLSARPPIRRLVFSRNHPVKQQKVRAVIPHHLRAPRPSELSGGISLSKHAGRASWRRPPPS